MPDREVRATAHVVHPPPAKVALLARLEGRRRFGHGRDGILPEPAGAGVGYTSVGRGTGDLLRASRIAKVAPVLVKQASLRPTGVHARFAAEPSSAGAD